MKGSVDTNDFWVDIYLWNGDYTIERPPAGGKLVATFYPEQDILYSYVFEPVIPTLNGINSFETLLRGKYQYGPHFSDCYDCNTFGVCLRLPIDTSCTVDISENFYKDNLFTIFPNPTLTTLIVSRENLDFQNTKNETKFYVIDNLGKEVKSGTIKEFPYMVSVEDLQDGMYVIILQNDNFYEKRKFVKQKR